MNNGKSNIAASIPAIIQINIAIPSIILSAQNINTLLIVTFGNLLLKRIIHSENQGYNEQYTIPTNDR
jgi:hypothetical protein